MLFEKLVWEKKKKKVLQDLDRHSVLETEAKILHVT